MSSSLESKVLLALWQMYQRNQISMEQKGCLKEEIIIFIQQYIIVKYQKKYRKGYQKYQIGSPRDIDAEEAVCPIIKQSNPSNTPTTVKSQQQQPQKRFRFMSSSNETEMTQNNQRVRSNSFHHK